LRKSADAGISVGCAGKEGNQMKAEQYLKRKESLSLALNGQDRLMDAAKDIEETLTKYNLDSMPETAFDVMCFTLETIHLRKINLSKFAL
jgi:hypothetical protein